MKVDSVTAPSSCAQIPWRKRDRHTDSLMLMVLQQCASPHMWDTWVAAQPQLKSAAKALYTTVWREEDAAGNQQVTQIPNTPKKQTEEARVPPKCHHLKWPKLSIWTKGMAGEQAQDRRPHESDEMRTTRREKRRNEKSEVTQETCGHEHVVYVPCPVGIWLLLLNTYCASCVVPTM